MDEHIKSLEKGKGYTIQELFEYYGSKSLLIISNKYTLGEPAQVNIYRGTMDKNAVYFKVKINDGEQIIWSPKNQPFKLISDNLA